MTKQTIFTDGMKAANIGGVWDDEYMPQAWTWFSGGQPTEGSALYRAQPWIYRAVNRVAEACTQVPWTIYRGNEEVTNSTDFTDPTGIINDPWGLIRILSMSLDLNGVAYLEKLTNRARVLKTLRYLAPSTINVEISPVDGTPSFKRSVGSRTVDMTADQIVYFWLPDPDVEVGPPQAWPAKSAGASGGALLNLDVMVGSYFQRGMVRPMIVTLDGKPPAEERARMKTWFQKLFAGINNAFKLELFESGKVNTQIVGDGLSELRDQTLTDQQRQSIATAFGIPFSILMSNASNFAVSTQDKINFYDETVIPRVDLIGDVLNQQVLTPLGFKLVLNPQSMSIYQEDEASRAASVGSYVSAGMPLLMALDILGVDLTDEQRAELEKKPEAPEAQTAPEAQQAQPVEQPAQQEAQSPDMTPDQTVEAKRWKRAAVKRYREKRPLPIAWDNEFLTDEQTQSISRALKSAADENGVRAAFEIDIKDLQEGNDDQRRAMFARMADDGEGGGGDVLGNSSIAKIDGRAELTDGTGRTMADYHKAVKQAANTTLETGKHYASNLERWKSGNAYGNARNIIHTTLKKNLADTWGPNVLPEYSSGGKVGAVTNGDLSEISGAIYDHLDKLANSKSLQDAPDLAAELRRANDLLEASLAVA